MKALRFPPLPNDFAAEERQRAVRNSQPMGWGGFLVYIGTLAFWAVVIGLILSHGVGR